MSDSERDTMRRKKMNNKSRRIQKLFKHGKDANMKSTSSAE